jgi:competence protein ComGC
MKLSLRKHENNVTLSTMRVVVVVKVIIIIIIIKSFTKHKYKNLECSDRQIEDSVSTNRY